MTSLILALIAGVALTQGAGMTFHGYYGFGYPMDRRLGPTLIGAGVVLFALAWWMSS